MTTSAEILHWLSSYQYLVLFPLAVAEGPVVTVAAGFLASVGQMNLWVAYSIIVAGDLTGDSLYYLLGRWGGRKGVHRWGHRIGLNEKRMEQLQSHFKKHPGKTLMLGKLAHGFGGPVLAAAGLANLPYFPFLFYNLLPTLPKSLLLIYSGFYFGMANRYLDSILLISLGLAAVLFLFFVISSRLSEYYLLKTKRVP